MISRLLAFFTDQAKTALLSILAAITGTEAPALETIVQMPQPDLLTYWLQIIAWSVAILAGVVSIYNAHRTWFKEKKKRQTTYKFR